MLRAMAVAKIYPDGGRGQTPRNLDFSAERVRQARTVFHEAPDLVNGVLAGTPSLDEAYQEAIRRKKVRPKENADQSAPSQTEAAASPSPTRARTGLTLGASLKH